MSSSQPEGMEVQQVVSPTIKFDLVIQGMGINLKFHCTRPESSRYSTFKSSLKTTPEFCIPKESDIVVFVNRLEILQHLGVPLRKIKTASSRTTEYFGQEVIDGSVRFMKDLVNELGVKTIYVNVLKTSVKDVPIDVLANILSFDKNRETVLSLAMTCKGLHARLMSQASMHLLLHLSNNDARITKDSVHRHGGMSFSCVLRPIRGEKNGDANLEVRRAAFMKWYNEQLVPKCRIERRDGYIAVLDSRKQERFILVPPHFFRRDEGVLHHLDAKLFIESEESLRIATFIRKLATYSLPLPEPINNCTQLSHYRNTQVHVPKMSPDVDYKARFLRPMIKEISSTSNDSITRLRNFNMRLQELGESLCRPGAKFDLLRVWPIPEHAVRLRQQRAVFSRRGPKRSHDHRDVTWQASLDFVVEPNLVRSLLLHVHFPTDFHRQQLVLILSATLFHMINDKRLEHLRGPSHDSFIESINRSPSAVFGWNPFTFD